MRNNRKSIIISLAVAGLLGGVIYLILGIQQVQHIESHVGPSLNESLRSKPEMPSTELHKGGISTALPGVSMSKLAEGVPGYRANSTFFGTNNIQDKMATVSLNLYNGSAPGGRDFIAAVLTNSGNKPVTIVQFRLDGYTHCPPDNGCAATALVRPIIDPFPGPIIKPTTNSTYVLEPRSSLTSFIQPQFNKDGYAASASYIYDPSDESTYYHTNTPLIWMR